MAAPKLRFKEFDRDWTTQSLGNVTDITKLAGYEFTKHINYQDSGEIIALRGLNVKGNNLVLEDVKYIDNSDLSMLSRSKLYIDDLLFTYVGTIGEVALIPENDKFYLAPNVCRIRRVNKNILSKYLMFLFSNENFKKNQIDKYTTKSSQPALSMENIRKFEIVFPSVEEQTKIAYFLSAVDEKISQLNRKNELLSQYKQGMMQKLFSQQIRFKADDGSKFGKWVNKKIIEIADYVDFRGKTPKKVDNGILLVTAKNIRFGYIDYEVSREYIGSDDFEEVMRRGCAKIGDVLITTEAPLGNVASVDREDIALAQRVIKYRGKEGILNNAFLKQKFLSEDFQALIASKATGGTVQGIKGSTLHNLEIYIPQDIEEQTKIANFLSAIDQKIEVVAQQIEQAKQWKKGLLQQMFV
ncbi:restriction endonuclease subunit S [Acinetobacter johnsonii]|nr:restriction endonuclease subunit S [Acinetobacter johnsonii]MDH2047636.1 restriction endonuclease subunit S [Acinetobacter johnsonii]